MQLFLFFPLEIPQKTYYKINKYLGLTISVLTSWMLPDFLFTKRSLKTGVVSQTM